MHIPSPLLLLSLAPYLAAAEDQVPLKDKAAGWFDKAKSYIPSAVPSMPNPVDAGAAYAASGLVEKINIRNWQRKLQPKLAGEEEWMVFLTGGNKSCFGRCQGVESMWNASVPLIKALPNTQNLKLGFLDCEKDAVLCTAWAAAVPSVWHFLLPQKPADASAAVPASALHIVPLNISTTTTSDIVAIPRASKSRYAEFEPYEGALHPIDGTLAKFGLLIPLGYLLWGFGSTPSWLMMIGISFISRQMMSRRMANTPDIYGQRAAQPAGAGTQARPAAAAGAAKKKK